MNLHLNVAPNIGSCNLTFIMTYKANKIMFVKNLVQQLYEIKNTTV